MKLPRQARGAAAVLAALLSGMASSQTWSTCNPLHTTSCPDNRALGMAINVDFAKGSVNSFSSSGGSPTYGKDGVSFSVARGGDAPQLISDFFIMFGRVELTMKSASGRGIVSSLVLQSDTLDEIDFEWLGADGSEVQSNYFGKGLTTSYNRGMFHANPGNQDRFIKYAIDWDQDRVIWSIDGTAVRTLKYADAAENQYPQTPMQVKFGAWSGGDPSNPPGTVEWARGPTDYSRGPFAMVVRSILVADYSTGKSYRYGDNSGSWRSIVAAEGTINGNRGKAVSPAITATMTSGQLSPSVPPGGIGKGGSSTGANARPTGTVPDGWIMTDEGKLIPASVLSGGDILSTPHPIVVALVPMALCILAAARGVW